MRQIYAARRSVSAYSLRTVCVQDSGDQAGRQLYVIHGGVSLR